MDDVQDEMIPANMVLFSELVALCEQLYKKKKYKKDQNKVLENFIDEFRIKVATTVGKKNSTFYPILRLLLPDCERERSPYNLKEKKLGDLLVKVLSLNKQSEAAQKLLNFRSVDNASKDGDFAGVAYFVLKNRVGRATSTLTVGAINELLDTIASAEVGNKGPILDEAFSYAMKNLTPVEFKWFLRIIIKGMKLNMSTQRTLAAFHPDAPELFQNCNNILRVCEEFEDGNTRPSELGVQMFYAVRPMLSERLDVVDINHLPESKTYQVEDKFDGERFQMHMENGVFEYYSRKGFSYSEKYGKNYDAGLLTPHLKDSFATDVNSCILDGEMMGWHKANRCFGSKGMAFDIKKVTENSSFRPCYCVFDVLYYNGKSLIGPSEKGGIPLRERLKLLDSLFTDVPGVILHSKRKIVKESSEILDALNKAIDNQDEGIVVKDIDSYYVANKRNAGWYKIKPEYTEGAATDLDLVVVGADEAENKSQGRAKSFYVACVDGSAGRWVCVGRVASGLTFEERERVSSFLETNWKSFKKLPAPPCLCFNKEKPDFWILPEHSIVLQIKATELIRVTSSGGYTLRFPRVTSVRADKPVGDIMTLEQLHQLVSASNTVTKLSTKRINEDQIGHPAEIKTRRTRASNIIQVAEQFRTRTEGKVTATSKALLGRKLCILSDDEDCKKVELIKLLELHGAKHTENIGPDTWCSVAGCLTNRVKKLIETQLYDIVPTSWLRQLPASDSPCALVPLDMLSMKSDTRLAFSFEYDTFGDSFASETDVATLKKCFDKMDSEPQIYLTTKEKLELDSQLFDNGNPFSFLRSCVINVKNPLYALKAKMYGAKISDVGSYVTHWVLPEGGKSEDISLETEGKIVSEDWLHACFLNKEKVSETEYLL